MDMMKLLSVQITTGLCVAVIVDAYCCTKSQKHAKPLNPVIEFFTKNKISREGPPITVTTSHMIQVHIMLEDLKFFVKKKMTPT
jgi:hypothetical protein